MIGCEIDSDNIIRLQLTEYVSIENLLEWIETFSSDPNLPDSVRMYVDTYGLKTRHSFDELSRIAKLVVRIIPMLKKDVTIAVVTTSERIRTATDICGKLIGVIPFSFRLQAFPGREPAENWLDS